VGANRELTLAQWFAVLGELDFLILRSSDATDSSSGVHDGEDCEGGGRFLADRLAIGSSRRRGGGTCGLVIGPMTPDAGGVGS